MARTAKKNNGNSVEAIRTILAEYQRDHPKADIEVKRQNPVAVRIRIVDPDFGETDLVEREKRVWRILERLPAKVRSDITFLLLVTPQENRESLASFDFDHPIASRL